MDAGFEVTLVSADPEPMTPAQLVDAVLATRPHAVLIGHAVTPIGSTRVDDIVRHADLRPLYRRAGVLRFLLALEGTDAALLGKVRKGGTRVKDQHAIQLLRENGMIGLCTFAVGVAEERARDYARILRQLLHYDPDQIMSVFATPCAGTHGWGAGWFDTSFAAFCSATCAARARPWPSFGAARSDCRNRRWPATSSRARPPDSP